MKVEYKIGDVLLMNIGYPSEAEITNIAVKARCIKIDSTWHKVEEITPKIQAVLGRAVYKKGWLGTKRTVEYL